METPASVQDLRFKGGVAERRQRAGVLLAILVVACTPGAATASANSWQRYRDFYLGPGREHLESFCAIWRDANAEGRSIWEPGLLRSLNEPLRSDGFSDTELDALTAAQAVAITQECSDIR